MSQSTARKAYPSDLTDAQWAILEPLIPPAQCSGRPRKVDMREIVNAMLYLNRTGCQRDMLPHDLPPKSSVYVYFAQWRKDGTWERLVDALRAKVRTEVEKTARRLPVPEALIASRSRQRGSLLPTQAMTEQRKSRDANVIWPSTPWVCCLRSL